MNSFLPVKHHPTVPTLGLAEFTLSRKDPAYVGRAKEVQKAQKAIEAGTCPLEAVPEMKPIMEKVHTKFPEAGEGNLGVGSTIFAVKPGARFCPGAGCILPESSWRMGKLF